MSKALGPKQCTNFSVQLDKWLEKEQAREKEYVIRVATALARSVIVGGDYSPGSPVDTGFFRAAWRVGINAPPAPTADQDASEEQLSFKGMGQKKAKAAPGTYPDPMPEITGMLAGAVPGDMIYISNSVIYGPRLEYGHSQQAPAGFVRLTVAAFESICRDVRMQMGMSRATA